MISDPNFTIIGTAESAGAGVSSLKAPSGVVKCPGQVAPTTGLKLWFPLTQGGGHPSVYHDIIFIHGTQGTATGSQLSFVPQLSSGNDPL